VRGRLLRILRRSAQADPGGPRRHGDQALLADDPLDLRKAPVVEVEHLVVGDLALLQLLDHLAVIRDGSPRSRATRAATFCISPWNLDETSVRAFRQLFSADVHADLAQLELVQLARQAEVLAGLGEHFGPHEPHVILELAAQRGDRLLRSRDLVLGEQLVDTVDQELRGLQIVLHLDAAGGKRPFWSPSRASASASCTTGWNPASRPAYLRTRTSAAGLRSAAIWGSSSAWTLLKISRGRFTYGTWRLSCSSERGSAAGRPR